MSGLIPQSFLDELLSRTDLIELIDGYVPLKKRGASFIACCPFHNEKSPSFNVVAKKQFYHCFGCGANGNAISFIMAFMNQEFIEAVETLAARLGLQVPRTKTTEKTAQALSLHQLLAKVSQFYEKNLKTKGKAAIDYLRERGLNGEIAKLYQLGYAPTGWQNLEMEFSAHRAELLATGMLISKEGGKTYDRFRHRIMFPIHDRHGRIIGFGGRVLEKEQKPKYLNSPETSIFQKSRELYGLHQILKEQNKLPNIIIVEGYMDVIALAQHGINNAVAALGTATSNYHIQLLSKHTKQLIFCFDGDEAGRQAAWRALESCLPELNAGLDAHFAFLPDGKDPDSLIRSEGKKQLMQYLEQAKPLSRFLFDTIAADLDIFSVSGKSQLINAAKPYLEKMQEGPYRQLLVNELARITHIENYRIVEIIQGNRNKKQKEENKKIKISPIRLAIAFLIQNPEIAAKAPINIDLLDGKDQLILQKLLRQIEASPRTNTAALIEAWRDTPYFTPLSKLASWEHQEPEAELVKKFTDIILFLQKQNLENKINIYLEKSRNQGLTVSERFMLQEMMKKRHQSHMDENN